MPSKHDRYLDAIRKLGASDKILEEYRELFSEAHFSQAVFHRLTRVLGYCDPDFFLHHYTSVWYKPYRREFEKESDKQLQAEMNQRFRAKRVVDTVPFKLRAMSALLRRFESIEPITLPLLRKAKKANLRAKFDYHPLLGKGEWSYPTLVFSDKEGPVFWTRIEPKGKEVVVGFIQTKWV